MEEPLIRGAFAFFLNDNGLMSLEPGEGEGWGSDPVRGVGRRKAATEIMPLAVRGCGGGLAGECGTAGDCGRERCIKLGLGGTSGGVRKGGVLVLDSEGEDGSAAAIFGGGTNACCFGDEGTCAR